MLLFKTFLLAGLASLTANAIDPSSTGGEKKTRHAHGQPAQSDTQPDVVPTVDNNCMAETICGLKSRIRWGRGTEWTPKFCKRIADEIISAGKEYDVHPALLLAIAVNESDLDESAVRVAMKGDRVFAKDGGLMGIRCVVNKQGTCINAHVKGLHSKRVMHPFTNIHLGARILAHYRDGGVTRVERRRRGPNGEIQKVTRSVKCRHATHAYWAHYNHGPVYKTDGYARHYPHRIAVLYHALAEALNLPLPEELSSRPLTVRDVGKRVRTSDRPVEHRYKSLVEDIQEAGACRSLALLAP